MLYVCRLAVALGCALGLAQGASALTIDNLEEGDFSVGPQPAGPPAEAEQTGLAPANVVGGTRHLSVLATGPSLASASLATTAGPDSASFSTPVPNPPGCPYPSGCGGFYTLVYDGIANLSDDGSDGTLGLDLSGFQAIEIDAVVTRASQPVGPLGPTLGPIICSIVPLPSPLCQPPSYLGFIPTGLCALGLCFPGAQLQLPPTRFQVTLYDSTTGQVPVFLPLVTGTNRVFLSSYTGVDLSDIQAIRVRLNGVVGSLSVSEIRAAALPVAVDLKPGAALNCVNPGSHGKTPVALLGSSDYDVLDVDASSLRFGGAAPQKCVVADVAPFDGFPDLSCKYKTQDVAWPAAGSDCGSVLLSGEETDGTAIEGSDVACLAGEPTCALGEPSLP